MITEPTPIDCALLTINKHKLRFVVLWFPVMPDGEEDPFIFMITDPRVIHLSSDEWTENQIKVSH